MDEIPFKEFQKLDLRIGQVVEAEVLENSRSLVKMVVDFGSEKRQVIAGIKNHYTAEQLIGNKYMFICNLERKMFMGLESQAMIFAASDEEGNLVLMKPEKDIGIGSKVK
ncbi:methionine--tRNA ligase [archaeon]|nr:MAG: methionine--tRNA ligase [archaeon]